MTNPLLTQERLRQMLWQMHTIRLFEEQVEALFQKGMIYGTTHLCIGQEGVAVGAIAAIGEGDYITSTHRGHGHCIAKGADAGRMMAELMGRATGYCHGKGGSMHIADVEAGNLGANGVVAGGITIATGAGLALKMQKRPNVCLCFFGDGATNEGDFHEGLNLAAVWQLPVVFICENNQYGMSGSVKRMSGNPNLHERAIAYGIEGVLVDGNDTLAVYEAVSVAVQRARSGGGPTLIVCDTYRYKGHSKSDANRYRTREEIEEWRRRDPISQFEAYVAGQGLTEADIAAIRAEAESTVVKAIEFAQNSPHPDPSVLLQDIYVD